MPLLGGLFVSLFSGLVAWFTQWVTRKVAFGLASVAAMSALTLALFVAMRVTLGELGGMSASGPSMFIQGIGMMIPPVAPACVSSYVTMWTACTVYTWQRDLLHLFAKAG